MQTDYAILMHVFWGSPERVDLNQASAMRAFATSWPGGDLFHDRMEALLAEAGDMRVAVTSRYPGFDGTAPNGRSDPAYREASSMVLFVGFVLSHRILCPDPMARQGVLRAIAREGAALLAAAPGTVEWPGTVVLGEGVATCTAPSRAGLASGLAWLDEYIACGPPNTDYAVLMTADRVQQGYGIYWNSDEPSFAHYFGTVWAHPLATAIVIAQLEEMPDVRAAVATRYPDFDENAYGGHYDPSLEEPLSMAVFVDLVTVYDVERLGPSLHCAILRAIAREVVAMLEAAPASAQRVPLVHGDFDRAGLASGLAWLRDRIAEGEALSPAAGR